MALDDLFGLPVTLCDHEAAAVWNKVMLGVLSHSAATPAALADVLGREPDFALGHAVRGLFCMMLGRREMQVTARAAAGEAEVAIRRVGATPREQRYLSALQCWLAGRPSKAAAVFETILEDFPEDALAMKVGQSIRFIIGDQAGMRASLSRLLPLYSADHPALGYLHGCNAFTLEEAGLYGEAERFGRRALELAPDDAWGLHAVAHIYDMTARPDEGVAFLRANEAAWAHCNNFRYHVWWHLALLHLDRGETDAALALYDAEIRRDHTDDYRDIANATSLLMRLELEGVSVGDRWEELADLCAARTDDGCLAFADLHYMLALCGGGREADAGNLVQRMHVDALRNIEEMDAVMRHPGLSFAKGLQAFTAGRFAAAFANMRAGHAALPAIGGSHAQRDVFERLTIDAALRSGALAPARTLIDDRTRRRGSMDRYAASRAQQIEALSGEAARSARNRLA